MEENKIETNNTTTPTPKKEGVVGPIIGSLIVILIIVLGGLYFWSYLIENRNDVSEIKDSENLETEVELLQQELQDDELYQIDSEIEQIESEINSELLELEAETQI